MKNLRLIEEISCDFQTKSSISHFTLDQDRKTLFFIDEDLTFHAASIPKDSSEESPKVYSSISLSDDSENSLIASTNKIVAIEFIPDLDSLCVATYDGDILIYEISQKQFETVGVIDSGIRAMSWSPDYEIVIFITGNNTVMAMTKDWEVLAENPIHEATTNTENKESNSVSNSSSPLPRISWRGDGNFFATMSTSSNTSPDVSLKTWDRSCNMSSKGENVKGLLSLVSWKPSGSIIASVQKSTMNNIPKIEVVFFERNGLRHGEFLIPKKVDENVEIRDVKWNSDSDIIAVHIDRSSGNSEESVVQLWTTSNYHWYLKKEFTFDHKRVSAIQWDSEAAMCLRAITVDATYFEFQLCWEYNVSQSLSTSNPSIVAVVNHNSLLFTPVRYSVVPPPMSASTLALKNNLLDFAFSTNCDLAVLTNDHTISIYSRFKSDRNIDYSDPYVLDLSSYKEFFTLRDLIYLSNSCLLAVTRQSWKTDSVIQIDFDLVTSSTENKINVKKLSTTPLPSRAVRMAQNQTSSNVYVELVDGTILQYHSEEKRVSKVQKLPSVCQLISSVTWNQNEVIVGLDNRSKLYADSTLISNECNSYFLHDKYLVFTTLSNTIRFVSLSSPVQEYQPIEKAVTDQKKKASYDDTLREVERGSKIVSVIPFDVKVVLQMPRGNLEVIYPRILLLDSIRSFLNKFQFNDAFLAMRKHRIDMNLIYDHNPSAFLEHIEEFVTQINNVDYLNLFISSLREDDVTETLFIEKKVIAAPTSDPNAPPNLGQKTKTVVIETQPPPKKGVKKINIICDRLRQVFQKIDSNKFLLPILTTYIKKVPQELEQVLEVIKSLKEKSSNESSFVQQSDHNEVSAEVALKYVCWLADVNNLYDVALGMYDFDLVNMVAQKSQKDPKEYLPYLAELQKMEKYYMQYTIDRQLGRHLKSLQNLSQAGEQYKEECLLIVKEHHLYEDAIEIFSQQQDKKLLEDVLNLYGDYLYNNGKFEESALVYVNCENHKKALTSFKNANDWKMVFTTAAVLNFDDEALVSLGQEMSESLKNLALFKEASSVLIEYCHNPEEAIQTLIRGSEWSEALRKCQQLKRNDLIENSLKPAVEEAYDALITELEDWRQQWDKQTARLQTVRINKLLMPKIDRNIDEESGSLFSEATSMRSDMSSSSTSSYLSDASGNSIRSYASLLSKESSRKRREKKVPRKSKRISAKEGSANEEEYLVNSLNRMIPSIKYQDDAGQLVRILIYFGQRQKAVKLQQLLSVYQQAIEDSLPALMAPLAEENTVNKPEPPKSKVKKESLQTAQQTNWKLSIFK